MTIRGSAFALLLLFSQSPATNTSLLIRNAQLIDGTGAPARRADVRVSGDTIAAVADRLEPRAGERVIDAGGHVLAPGFIDMHSHGDRGLDDMPDAATQVRQGITTAVVGQDGSSELPVAKFYAHIDTLHPAINYATSVGHGSVRTKVMG